MALQAPLPHLCLWGDSSPSPLPRGDSSGLLQGSWSQVPPSAPRSPSAAVPASDSACRAWRRSRGRQQTGCGRSEAWVVGGPGQPPGCRPGLEVAGVVSKWPGNHAPPPWPPQLTNVSPVVGVPGALVVSKAQLHLHAVGRQETDRWASSPWGPVIQALALTPVLGKGETRALRRKGRDDTGEVHIAGLGCPWFLSPLYSP